MKSRAILRTGLLAFCGPKTPLEIGLLALVSIMSITGISVILSGPFDRLDLRYALVFAFFIFGILTIPLARLAKITRALRFLKSPSASRTLMRTLSRLGLSWGLVCALFCLFEGFYGCLLILTLTGILVMLYSQAFYLASQSFLLHVAFPISMMRFLKYFDGWIAITITALAIIAALVSARTARFAWHNLEFALAEPTEINFNAPINAHLGRRTANLSNELRGDAWPDMLRYFGLGSLAAHARYALWLVALMAAAGFAAYFLLAWERAFVWLSVLPVALCIIFLIGSDEHMLALYGCKAERVFLCTLPGLPTPKMQAKLLRRHFWLRFGLPFALLFSAIAIAIALIGKAGAGNFFATMFASGFIAARIIELRVAQYAAGAKLGAALGIFAPLVLVAGAFLALIGYALNRGTLFTAIAAGIAMLVIFMRKRGQTAMSLSRRD
jgi:hypothetical protein